MIVVHEELRERASEVPGTLGWALGMDSRIQYGTGFDLTNLIPKRVRNPQRG